MWLIKKICDHLRRPYFEVENWPASELDKWAVSFSIDINKDKPDFSGIPKPKVSAAETKARFQMAFRR